jgi:pre-mRNA-splicing factor ATP-dependent RNA helicase DHX38/PRP16
MHECCSRYGREEGGATFDADIAEPFLGDETTFKKRETAMTKRLTRRDGTQMSLAQSKMMSQLSADNAQWEDRQLLRSGAVRGTELQTEFDNEDENRVILLVHGVSRLSSSLQSCGCKLLNRHLVLASAMTC